jgi:hypothetical protein
MCTTSCTSSEPVFISCLACPACPLLHAVCEASLLSMDLQHVILQGTDFLYVYVAEHASFQQHAAVVRPAAAAANHSSSAQAVESFLQFTVLIVQQEKSTIFKYIVIEVSISQPPPEAGGPALLLGPGLSILHAHLVHSIDCVSVRRCEEVEQSLRRAEDIPARRGVCRGRWGPVISTALARRAAGAMRFCERHQILFGPFSADTHAHSKATPTTNCSTHLEYLPG